MPPQPDQSWIFDQLSTLTNHADELRAQSSLVNEFKPWAAAKLSMLAATIDVYTKIIPEKFDDAYYIDAMAGSGVVDVEGYDATLVGSPIIAATLSHAPGFEKMYCIELDPDKASALENRLEYLADSPDFDLSDDDFQVIDGDANEEIPPLIDRIKRERGGFWKGAHQLAFVDNEHVDVGMDTIQKMSEMWNDMLITLQTPNIQMKVTGGRVKDFDEYDRFFGDTVYRSLTTEDEFRRHYLDKLGAPPVDRPIRKVVNIRGSKTMRYNYDLVYAARETDGGSPWVQFADGMKRRLGNLSSETIGHVLDQLQGDAAPLAVWSDEGPGIEAYTDDRSAS